MSDIANQGSSEINDNTTIAQAAEIYRKNSGVSSREFETTMTAFSNAIKNDVREALHVVTDPTENKTEAQAGMVQVAVVWLARSGFGERTLTSLFEIAEQRANKSKGTE
jgi:hypothetical protein